MSGIRAVPWYITVSCYTQYQPASSIDVFTANLNCTLSTISECKFRQVSIVSCCYSVDIDQPFTCCSHVWCRVTPVSMPSCSIEIDILTPALLCLLPPFDLPMTLHSSVFTIDHKISELMNSHRHLTSLQSLCEKFNPSTKTF